MALAKSESLVYREKDGPNLGARLVYNATHTLDLEHFRVIAALREPPDPKHPDQGDPADGIAKWFPDGKTVLTVDAAPRASKVRLWDARSGKLLKTFSLYFP